MAQPHCEKHKRFVPYCDACKAAVKAAEEAELQAEQDAHPEVEEEEARAKQAVLDEAIREEESNALQAEVGFPSSGEPFTPTPPEVQPTVSGEGVEGGPGPDAEPPEDVDAPTEEDLFGPELDLPTLPLTGRVPVALEKATGSPRLPEEVIEMVEEIIQVLDTDEEVTLFIGDGALDEIRQEGRKEVIKMVKEYFADGTDTVAFQLLEYLNKKVAK